MDEQSEIREAARTIRSYLSELLDADAATETDRALAKLLASSAADERILVELERHDATAEWAAAFVEHGVPPEFAPVIERTYSEVPGHGEAVGLPKFVCPKGDFVWYRHAVGETPPLCPTHGQVVVRVLGAK
jgi:hypothetical protein